MKYQSQVDFDEDHIKYILYNLLCSMKFIHSADIMHRDIKPGNILINADCQIKICDFGLSRSRVSYATDDMDWYIRKQLEKVT